MVAERKQGRGAPLRSAGILGDLPIEVEPAERARVLVVDDDERNLLAIRTVLEDVADYPERCSHRASMTVTTGFRRPRRASALRRAGDHDDDR